MDTGEDTLFVVTGIGRSGTIWIVRLLADSLLLASQTRYNDPPFAYEDDPAVWHTERPGKVIRRLHDDAKVYPYPDIPCVVVMRDPRDVAISEVEVAGHEKTTTSYDGLARYILPSWCDFYQGWQEDMRMVRTVRYEDFLRDAKMEITLTVGALGLHSDPVNVARAIAANEFSTMKNWRKGCHGKSGMWHGRLSPETARFVWQEYGEVLSQFGYTEDGVE